MPEPTPAARVLLQATARARALRGRCLVVKLGGSAMEDPAATRGTLESVVALQTLGVRLVLVHGGGKPIDRAMAAAGLTPKKVAGRRYTDEATLEIVVKVLRDDINADICRRIDAAGGKAYPMAPAYAADVDHVLYGERLTLTDAAGAVVDLGHVGRIVRVEHEQLTTCFDGQFLPVVPSLAIGPDGGWLNVNADTASSAVAGALQADACYFLTDTPGVLRDVTDPTSLLPRLSRRECQQLIADGVIAGGMVPKVEACFEALDAGAGRAVILDGRNPYALLGEFVAERITGTEITK